MMLQPWPKTPLPSIRHNHAKLLARTLGELTVQVDSVLCRFGTVAVSGYPGGQRPTTIVALSGRGETGYGEHVGFTPQEHTTFYNRIGALVRHRGTTSTVAQGLAEIASPYERAALQSALIDLSLRQHRTSLRDLCGGGTVPRIAPLRWVHSSDILENPALHVRAMRAAGRAMEFKLDVNPNWSDHVIADLGRESGVVTLDFKAAGDAGGDVGNAEAARRLSAHFPAAIFEDPPPGTRHPLIARDRQIMSSADVASAMSRGELVNLKIPRMGGPLALLEALAAAPGRNDSLGDRFDDRFYFGGMFEIGPGREQARQLAALFCGDAPNDLGPLPGAMSPPRPRSPSWVRLDLVGFGATCAWSQLLPSPL